MTQQAQKDAFICHTKADKEWAKMLGARIEAETTDGQRHSKKLSVFLDEWDIEGGENIVKRLGHALKNARHVIAVLSPEFFASGWTTFEWTDVVAEDPAGLTGKLLPAVHRDASIDGQARIWYPAPFKALHRFDFRENRPFLGEFHKLLRRLRGQKPLRGKSFEPAFSSKVAAGNASFSSALPDSVQELLVGNLLEVISLPAHISSADTALDETEVREEVQDAAPLIIKAGRLWTFADLAKVNEPLRAVVNPATIQSIAVSEWTPNRDESKALWHMEVLNKALTTHLSKLAIKKDRKGRYFFRPGADGANRVWKNAGGREREVASKKLNEKSGATFWVHHAANIKFRRLGARLLIELDPLFLFTEDGNAPIGGDEAGRMSVMWGGRQRNPDVLRNILFWIKAISRSSRDFDIATGGVPIKVSGVPAIIAGNVGLECDHIRAASLLNAKDDALENAAQDVEVVEEGAEDEETQQTP